MLISEESLERLERVASDKTEPNWFVWFSRTKIIELIRGYRLFLLQQERVRNGNTER